MKDHSAIVASLLETQRALLADLNVAYSRERALLRKLRKFDQDALAKATAVPRPSAARNRARRIARETVENPRRSAKKVLSKLRSTVGKK